MRRHFDRENSIVDGQPEVFFHERFNCIGRRDAHTVGAGHDHAVDTLVLGLQHIGQVADRVRHWPHGELAQLAPGRQRNCDRGQSSSQLNVDL